MALGQQTQQLFESFERIPESAARGELQREQLEASRQQRELQREQLEASSKQRELQFEQGRQRLELQREQLEGSRQQRELQREQGRQQRELQREQLKASRQQRELQREQLKASRQQLEFKREQAEKLKFKSAMETFNAMQKIFSSNLTEQQLQEIKENPERGMELVDEFREGNAVADKAMLDLGFERGSLGTFMTRQGTLGGKTRYIITENNRDAILQKIANKRNVPVESLSPDEAPIGGALETFISDGREDFVILGAPKRTKLTPEEVSEREQAKLGAKVAFIKEKEKAGLQREFTGRTGVKERAEVSRKIPELKDLVQEGLKNGFVPDSVKGQLAELISKERRKSDEDIKRVGGDPDIFKRTARFVNRMLTGTFTDADARDINSALDVIAKSNEIQLLDELARFSETKSKLIDLSPTDIQDILKPEITFGQKALKTIESLEQKLGRKLNQAEIKAARERGFE